MTLKYLQDPDFVGLGGGLPHPDYFPIESVSFTYQQPRTDELGNATIEKKSGSGNQLSLSMQYLSGRGLNSLMSFAKEHMTRVHTPQYTDWDCAFTIGSTSGLDFLYRMFLNEGDWLIVEEYMYPSALTQARAAGYKLLSIRMDEQGMLADDLEQKMELHKDDDIRPRVVYLVPTGQNPTGSTMSLERRKSIYAVAQKYDLVIIEDEPYYYLQMPPYGTTFDENKVSHKDFIDSLVPSFFSLDTDGRVVRIDSVSKIIAPGLRLGWITASKAIANYYVKLTELATQAPSGLSLAVLDELFNKWGQEGFLDWLIHIRKVYTIRRDSMIGTIGKYFGKSDIASWVPPVGGMFAWVKIDVHKHPEFSTLSYPALIQRLFDSAIAEKVLVIPSEWFYADGDKPETQQAVFFRISFSFPNKELMDKGIKRLYDAVSREFTADKKKDQRQEIASQLGAV